MIVCVHINHQKGSEKKHRELHTLFVLFENSLMNKNYININI